MVGQYVALGIVAWAFLFSLFWALRATVCRDDAPGCMLGCALGAINFIVMVGLLKEIMNAS